MKGLSLEAAFGFHRFKMFLKFALSDSRLVRIGVRNEIKRTIEREWNLLHQQKDDMDGVAIPTPKLQIDSTMEIIQPLQISQST